MVDDIQASVTSVNAEMQSSCSSSQFILLVCGAMGAVYEPALVCGLRNLGHRVEIIDASPGRKQSFLSRVEDRLLIGPSIFALRRILISRVRAERPDFVIIYQGHGLDRATISEIAKYSFVSGIHNDDPFGERSALLRYRHLLPALPAYDGFHVYRDVNVEEARVRGVPRVGILRPYYVPWLDYPRELTSDELGEWECDVVFAGHYEPDGRERYLSRLVDAGYKTRIYGPTRFWKRALPTDVWSMVGNVRPLDALDYRRAILGSKIATCFFSKWNRDQYTRRVFEITAMGRLLLSERTDFMSSFFKDNEEVAMFDSMEEFADKANYYLRNSAARERIARAGRERVLGGGCDVFSRSRQLVNDLARWRAHKSMAPIG